MFSRLLMIVSLFVAFYASAVSRAADAVLAQGGTAVLTPQNTKIQFVCAHVGAKPDPRKGGFGKFSGKAVVDGNFQSGETRFSLQNDATGYTLDNPLADGSAVPADIIAQVDKLAADIKSGAQVPPADIPNPTTP